MQLPDGLSETEKILLGVGVGVGGTLLLIIAVAVVMCCYCFKKKSKSGKRILIVYQLHTMKFTDFEVLESCGDCIHVTIISIYDMFLICISIETFFFT